MKRPATVILAVLATAAPASAQGGLTVDPDSPAGKEYALPLETARRDAAGGDATPAGGRAAPLFGEGVGDAAPAGDPAGRGARTSGDDGGRTPPGDDGAEGAGGVQDETLRGDAAPTDATVSGSGTTGDGSGGVRAAGARHGAAVVRAEGGGWADAATAAALAAAVLVLGGVLGRSLRRRAT